MKVTRGNVLLEVDQLPKKASTFVLTDKEEEVSDRATVIAVGPDSVTAPGDKVLWNNRQGRFVVLDDKEYVLVDSHDIFIIL